MRARCLSATSWPQPSCHPRPDHRRGRQGFTNLLATRFGLGAGRNRRRRIRIRVGAGQVPASAKIREVIVQAIVPILRAPRDASLIRSATLVGIANTHGQSVVIATHVIAGGAAAATAGAKQKSRDQAQETQHGDAQMTFVAHEMPPLGYSVETIGSGLQSPENIAGCAHGSTILCGTLPPRTIPTAHHGMRFPRQDQ